MDKNALWKWLAVIAAVCLSIALVYPPKEKIRLGLDLKGGTSFTVQIDAEKIKEQLAEDNPDWSANKVDSELPRRVERAREQALEIIRNRVDSTGIAEPMIYPEKADRVVIQLPGLKEEDRENALDLIKRAAFLEFALVHEDNYKLTEALFTHGDSPEGYTAAKFTDRGASVNCFIKDKGYVSGEDAEVVRQKVRRFKAPHGYRLLLKEDEKDGHKYYVPYYIEDRYQLSGTALSSAKVEIDNVGRPYITLEFDGKGAKRFGQITSDYGPQCQRNPESEGRQLAIIMD
ncbi:MAG: hypothetical protein GX811_12690, partial [Lentisphaerae bacterium]|nr:hypothetical protein [Lentisphaerota bacterium]